MKIIDIATTVVTVLVIMLWIFASRVRKRIIRRCWIKVVVEDGKKITLNHFKKDSVDKKLIKRCGCLRVKRRYTTLLPIGESVSFFVRPESKLRFRARIYDVSKAICCHCPDCRSITCIDVKRHSSISVVHGYWIKFKQWIKDRLGMDYENEFFLDEKTKAAIETYGDDLKRGNYAQLDADGSLPPTIISVTEAVFDELD